VSRQLLKRFRSAASFGVTTDSKVLLSALLIGAFVVYEIVCYRLADGHTLQISAAAILAFTAGWPRR
jgi:hypothetical protein